MTGILAANSAGSEYDGAMLVDYTDWLNIEHGIYLVMGAASASVAPRPLSRSRTCDANNLNAPLLTVHD
jgi:hypothetical protein